MSQVRIYTPKVRFFTLASGGSVAYASHGSGPYLLVPAWWVSHLELDWQDDDFRAFFESLGQHHTVVRYDRPGVGLSDRQRSSFDLDDEVVTLTELLDHLGAPCCSLLGISCGGPVATVFTHINPNRVEKLILVSSFVDGNDIGNDALKQALCALVAASWGMGANAILDLFDPDMSAEQRKSLAKRHKESASAEMAALLLELTFRMDATHAAQNLIKPALVLHRSKDRTITAAAGRRLAAMIPNAQFKSLEGKSHLPWVGKETDQFVREVLAFTQGDHSRTQAEFNQFRQMGDVWVLTYDQKTVHVKDALGLRDLRELISHPGQDIHARLLANGEAGIGQANTDEAEILDGQALGAYRQRLIDIDAAQQQAAAGRDESLYEALEAERDTVQHELTRALGLSGRQRTFSCDNEKARKAISARIRGSIDRIDSLHAELGEHLRQSIRTGNFCCYEPVEPQRWRV